MDEKPRYSVRAGAVALTRRQWLAFVSVLAAGFVAAVVLSATISIAGGGIALGAAAVISALILGFGRAAR